jgi:hypothetical protein
VRRSQDPKTDESGRAAYRLAVRYVAGKLAAKARVEKILSLDNFTIDSIYAQALVKQFDSIERIDQMIMVLERRRNSVFREIDRHSMSFSRALRDNVDKIEDAEFEEVEPEIDSPKLAGEETAA